MVAEELPEGGEKKPDVVVPPPALEIREPERPPFIPTPQRDPYYDDVPRPRYVLRLEQNYINALLTTRET